MVSYSKEDLQDLADDVADVLEGNAVDLCISALLTTLVHLITDAAKSAGEAKRVTEHVHELIAPAAVQDLWVSQQAKRHH